MRTCNSLVSQTLHTYNYGLYRLNLIDVIYDRRLDSYFVREGIKRKNKKADLEKITHEEYTLDWSQCKVFLIFTYLNK